MNRLQTTYDGRPIVSWQCSDCLETTFVPLTTREGWATRVFCPNCRGKGTKHYDRSFPAANQRLGKESNE